MDVYTFRAWCFLAGAAATLVCLHSLIAWQAREALERIAARRKSSRTNHTNRSMSDV